MPSKAIRKVSIGPDYKGGAMHYIVGQAVVGDTHRIEHIIFDDSSQSVKIYISNDRNEVMVWKEFNHTIPMSIEYDINY